MFLYLCSCACVHSPFTLLYCPHFFPPPCITAHTPYLYPVALHTLPPFTLYYCPHCLPSHCISAHTASRHTVFLPTLPPFTLYFCPHCLPSHRTHHEMHTLSPSTLCHCPHFSLIVISSLCLCTYVCAYLPCTTLIKMISPR